MHIFPTMSLCGPNMPAVGDNAGVGDQVRGTDQVILSPWLVSAPSVVDTLWEGLIRNIKNLILSACFNGAFHVLLPCTSLSLVFRFFSF